MGSRKFQFNLRKDEHVFEDLSSDPPFLNEHHVRLPDQVASLLNAESLHRKKITGRNIRVAVIDSGFFRHPYYERRGYRVRYVPTAREPEPHVDEYGHGTAQLASLFATAPEVEALVIKCMDRDPSFAFDKALELKPHVISCAWGFNIDHPGRCELPRAFRRLYRLILKAHEQGVTVVAAGGNGQRSFPGSMPQVIAAGGVYYAPDRRFYPSDVSSKFQSHFFPGRHVPDVCGIVGNRPHGRLLLVPVPPRARLARRSSFRTIAAGDSAEIGRGWAMFSGTSAATAMVSGVCALALQVAPRAAPAELKSALIAGAREISSSDRLVNAAGAIAWLMKKGA